MIQIGVQPLSATLAEGPLPDPDQAIADDANPEGRMISGISGDASDGGLFVSPPPLPFPRVFPGL
jgi:hypothetical protein